MQWNIKNAEEQIQKPLPIMNRPPSIPQLQSQSRIQLSIQTFKKHKTQYIALLFLLLEILLTVVVFVLFMTLNYVGFGRVNQTYRADKIFFDGENCQDKYLVQFSKFIPIKIKTAFVLICFQFLLAFVNVLLGFLWTIKVIKNSNQPNYRQLNSLRRECRALNILIPLCILLVSLIFGTYVQFAVIGNRTSFNTECRLDVLNKEVISIASLMGVKLALYLAIWMIILCVTTTVNKFVENQYFQGRGLKLPAIKELHSIFVGEERLIRQKGNQVGNRHMISNKGSNEDEQIFKQLKTEEFLLELKNNSKQKQAFETNQNQLKSKPQKLRKPEQQAQYQQSHRRMLVYRPLESQKYESDKNIPLRKQQQIKITVNNNHNDFKRQSSLHQYSVNNSLEKEKDHNEQLLINSVERATIDKLGTLPLSSKKKSFNEIQKSENVDKQKLRINFDITKQYPPKDQRKQIKIVSNFTSEKNQLDISPEIRKVDSIEQTQKIQFQHGKPAKVINTKTRLPKAKEKMNQTIQKQFLQSRQQIPQLKSIIMRLDSLSEKSKKDIKQQVDIEKVLGKQHKQKQKMKL